MALLSIIRRWHLRDHLPIREIARRTGLSRNTIRKYLRAGTVEPRFKVPERPSKLDPFAERLSAWLKREMGRPRKQKRTMKQLHADLVALGYDGSYGRVAAFARAWRDDYRQAQQMSGRGTYVPLAFAPGEAFQFDWSEDWAIIDGVRTKLQVAHFKLSHSRAFLVRAYLLQTHEMLFDAHNHAFRVLGGVPRRGIYDNMRTAVDKVGRGKERTVNARFLAMVSHYLFEAEFCNPAAGWEKGQVEKNVQDARHRLWQPVPQAESLDALNLWLEQRCRALWQEIPHGIEPGSVADAWADEVQSLMPMGRLFDGFVELGKRVSPTCLVHLDRNRYSVPASFANRPVSLRIYPDRILVAAEGQVICEHQRIIDRSHHLPGHTVYDWRHYLAVVQRKPGALRNGAPFLEMPDAFRRLQTHLLRTPGGDREMVEILSLVLHHDEQAVLTAVERALEAGVPTKTHILNLLHRLLDGKPTATPPVTAPQALRLVSEPMANVERYDALRRETRHAS
ncbi:IS21 family transposase [Sphingobium sp. DEHP117]|uniref:IS21 family transposase n=1 Tax=Sphingobium sp. DEHP117 TaxID=2993436 RepID=UPI0027D4B26A|nr:IS21 family transposase [Sphingobium sp. DEHP117]MDQ4419133.1 IS21 family transposase [Sphingobium sp. DEHP117]MDQ4420060.1 IS21 family transposase [Sphingobium sp. DEHP117]MDQ4420325.1 IS21 family transposase [Sphingobium sp. DEHP117]MDQ4420987.1 IS21 family transposase [Sphingobium sp. DEHP117]MDQ4421673.1 IS21 family transposase [Sphingobium sp. DEHP117]